MKKLILFSILVVALISISCEDSLSPKTPFNEEYALFCIVSADTSIQTASISHSYQVEGYNGSENKTDPALQGARVKITVNDNTIYYFSETEATRLDTSRYKTSFKYYSLANYRPVDNDRVEIQAVLSNGKVLKSSSMVPPKSNLYFSTSTMVYDPYDPSSTGEGSRGIKFGWNFLNSQYVSTINYFAPRLELVYHTTDNPTKKMRIRVPYHYFNKGDYWVPVYPKVSTATEVIFFGESVERSLNLISEGDANKSRYVIEEAQFTLLFMDRNVAAYIASESTFNDEFSMRIDAADFTNIQGGLGMFGVYTSKKVALRISKYYIKTFGYQTSY